MDNLSDADIERIASCLATKSREDLPARRAVILIATKLELLEREIKTENVTPIESINAIKIKLLEAQIEILQSDIANLREITNRLEQRILHFDLLYQYKRIGRKEITSDQNSN